MRLRENFLGPLRELDRISLGGDTETVDRNAVNDVAAFRQLVFPRDVIAMRARRQHLDLDVPGEVFRDITRMLLGAAVDIGAVALNDDRDLHCRSSSESGALGAGGASGALVASGASGDSSAADSGAAGADDSGPSPIGSGTSKPPAS